MFLRSLKADLLLLIRPYPRRRDYVLEKNVNKRDADCSPFRLDCTTYRMEFRAMQLREVCPGPMLFQRSGLQENVICPPYCGAVSSLAVVEGISRQKL